MFANKKRVYLVLELARNGTVLDAMNKKLKMAEAGKKEELVRKYFTDIINGLSYMHSLKIAHR